MPKVWVCYCVHHQKVVCFVPNLLTAVSSLLFFLVSGMGGGGGGALQLALKMLETAIATMM